MQPIRWQLLLNGDEKMFIKQKYQQTKQKNKQAFIASIIAVSLSLLLLTIWVILNTSSLIFEKNLSDIQPITFSSFIFDDVGSELESIVGPAFTLEETNVSVKISISDKLPKQNFTGLLSNYKTYLETNFSNNIHANLSANFSNLTDGALELFFLNNGYQYRNNYTDNDTDNKSNSIIFQSISATNATYYEVNFTVLKFRNIISSFISDPTGDINVTVRASDLNDTYLESATINSTLVNTFKVNYTDGSDVSLTIGRVANTDGGLQLIDNDASPEFSFVVILPLQDAQTRLVSTYNAMLNYSQGKVSKVAMIEK